MPPKRKRGGASSRKGRAVSKGGTRSRSQSRHRPLTPPRPATPPPFPWPMRDNDMQLRYNSLVIRPMDCTKYIDEDALHHLELHEPVFQYLSRLGWTKFARTTPHSYSELTLEFLSSLSAKVYTYNESDDDTIQFRMMGQEFTLTVAQINHIFEFPQGVRRVADPAFSYINTWRELAYDVDEYSPGKSKESKLRDHALRCIHRFMAHSIFARGESQGVVSRVELYILDAMRSGEAVNMGYWIVKHLQHVARSTSGKICVGGIISMIAEACGVPLNLPIHSRIGGSERIDLMMLLMMRVCTRGRDGGYYLKNHDGSIVPKNRHHDIPDVPVPGDADQQQDEEGTDNDQPVIPDIPPAHTYESIPSSSQSESASMALLLSEMRAMRTDFSDFRHHVDDRFDVIEGRIDAMEEMIDYIHDTVTHPGD